MPIYRNSSLLGCASKGTVYNRTAALMLVPQNTHYTKAQEHRFTKGNFIYVTTSDGNIERLLSSHTTVQLSVGSRTCKIEKESLGKVLGD